MNASTAPDPRDLIDWLIAGAPGAPEPQHVLHQLCDHLTAAGMPLWRAAVFVRTLHPQVMGRQFLWRYSAGVAISAVPYDITSAAEFQSAALAAVWATGTPLRRRLCDTTCPADIELLTQLKSDGVTDYLVLPLPFTDGQIHGSSWATREPGGFTAAQVAEITSIAAALARVAEIRALRRTAGNLLNTYVGHHAGERILAGRIRRGDCEAIHAAIWLSDMRGFTTLADRLPPQTIFDLLNRYFDTQVPAISAHGGAVLKFMGDGLLAIFPIAGNDADSVCGRALAAARQTRANVAAMAPPENGPPVRFGLALHIGEVLYGNIGSGERLDFTCIGPAVNLTARLESLAGKLGRPIVTSGEFASHCPGELARIGEFALPGFAVPQQVLRRSGEVWLDGLADGKSDMFVMARCAKFCA